MKKIFTVISLAALALNASAYDKLEAGTADAPNYYVIKANRGVPYLAYTADGIMNGDLTTKLYRTSELAEANIWAVTPGSEEGSLLIKNYTNAKGALMNFLTNDESMFEGKTGGLATTVGTAKDIYPQYLSDGSVGLSLKNAQGFENVGGDVPYRYYSLDATGGASTFCGNWFVSDDAGSGTKWWAYKVDINNIQGSFDAINQGIIAEKAAAMVQEYINYITIYRNAVPWVATELNAGIDQLNSYVATADYESDIVAIWEATIASANEALGTVFNGKTVAISSLRRAAGNVAPYMGVKDIDGNLSYGEYDSFANPNARFTFEVNDEGNYLIYNAETKTYVGNDANGYIAATSNKEEAVAFNAALNSNSGYTGVIFPKVDGNGQGLNFQSWTGGKVSYWSTADGGSIWGVVEASEDAMLKDLVEPKIAALEAYIPSLPEEVVAALREGIANLRGLQASATAAEEATEIYTTAYAAANDVLATGMNDFKLTLENLRAYSQDTNCRYLNIADGTFVYAATDEPATTVFTFQLQADGGYVLYNEAAKVYLGEIAEGYRDEAGTYHESEGTMVTEAADAAVIYPMLCSAGEFYGVALAFENDPEGNPQALNMNRNQSILHTYVAKDGGSIFALHVQGDNALLIDQVAAPAINAEGIYDLQGRKLAAPIRGLNIINGRKVLVK